MPRSYFDRNLVGTLSPSDVDHETAEQALVWQGYDPERGPRPETFALAVIVANVRRNVEAECEASFAERMRRVEIWSADVRAALVMQPATHEARTTDAILRDALGVAEKLAIERWRRFGRKGA